MSEAIGLLAPQSCRPIRLGGVGGLTGIDIAHACNQTGELGYALINIKHNNDKSCFGPLLKMLAKRINNEATVNKWKLEKMPLLIHLAIIEYTGNKLYKDKNRAMYLNISPSCWCRVWKSKYRRLLEILEYSEQSTLHQIKNNLK